MQVKPILDQLPEVTLTKREAKTFEAARVLFAGLFAVQPGWWRGIFIESPEELDCMIRNLLAQFGPPPAASEPTEQDGEPGGAEPEGAPRTA